MNTEDDIKRNGFFDVVLLETGDGKSAGIELSASTEPDYRSATFHLRLYLSDEARSLAQATELTPRGGCKISLNRPVDAVHMMGVVEASLKSEVGSKLSGAGWWRALSMVLSQADTYGRILDAAHRASEVEQAEQRLEVTRSGTNVAWRYGPPITEGEKA